MPTDGRDPGMMLPTTQAANWKSSHIQVPGTPLVMVVYNHDLEMVKYLIERGADINFPPRGNLTPLFAAYFRCIYDEGSKTKEILHLLLRSGANVCFEMEVEDEPVLMTVLHTAALNKDMAMFQMLLGSETANVNFQLRESPSNVRMGNQDTTEDKLTIDEPKVPSVEIRLSQVDPSSTSARDTNGSRGDEDPEGSGEIDDAISVPDNRTSNDEPGSDFIFYAHQSDSSELSDSSQNHEYAIGATPLHLAARGGLVKNVKLLLKHEADPHVKTASGYTAMDFALELTPIDGSRDDKALDRIKVELIELLEQNSYISLDVKESCPVATSLDR